MPYVSSAAGNEKTNIYYEDLGAGKPVVFIHGWPLSGSMWEYQLTQLPQKGLRCIAYDRRGFGKSDRPFSGYDYVTMAGDLKALLDHLDLQDVTLVGFSMGGGEVAKYFSEFGGERVTKVVMVSTVAPFLLKDADNPDGVPREEIEKILAALAADRPSFLEGFNKNFYGVSIMKHPASDVFLNVSTNKAMDASPIATIECAKSFSFTDFRKDMAAIKVPTLVIHGDEDAIVPIKATGDLAAKMIAGAKYIVYEGAPHGLWFTHKEKLNDDLLTFIK